MVALCNKLLWANIFVFYNSWFKQCFGWSKLWHHICFAWYIEQQCHWVRSITVDLDWFLSHNAHFYEYQWQQFPLMPEARYSKLYEWLRVLLDFNSSAILLILFSTFVCPTNMSWIFCSRMLCQIPANDAMLLLHSKRGWSQNEFG